MNPPIRSWRGLRVWIIGASSGIGSALAHELSRQGAELILSARRLEAMQGLGLSKAKLIRLDVCDPQRLAEVCGELLASDGVDLVVWMAGIYRPLSSASYKLEDALDMTRTNYVALLYALEHLLPYFLNRSQKHPKASGGLAIVSSVAGFRGLPKALAYGPTKAALSHLAEVLHLELAPKGIGVWVIHPGFVQTPATAINDFTMPALISAEQAALEIAGGLQKAAFEIHFPRRFTYLMKALRLLPDRIYFPLLRRALGPTGSVAAKKP